MIKTNKFDLGKDILNKSSVIFKSNSEEQQLTEKKKTKPPKAIEEQKRHKVGVYFTDAEFEKLTHALMNYANDTKRLPKMASFLHELIMREIEK